MYQPILEVPSDSAHGFPWKVHINDVNPQDSTLDPFGPETIKFDVFSIARWIQHIHQN